MNNDEKAKEALEALDHVREAIAKELKGKSKTEQTISRDELRSAAQYFLDPKFTVWQIIRPRKALFAEESLVSYPYRFPEQDEFALVMEVLDKPATYEDEGGPWKRETICILCYRKGEYLRFLVDPAYFEVDTPEQN